MERFLEYWQAAWQQHNLHTVTIAQLQKHWQTIARVAINSGKIAATDVAAGLYMIIPYYAQLHRQYFCPYFLLVAIDAQGEFCVQAQYSLPILPRMHLEPAPLQPITLGQAEDFANYLAITPPEWLDDPQQLTWQQQLTYAQEMLDAVNPNWRAELAQVGFTIQEHGLIVPVTALCTEFPSDNLDQTLLEHPDKITLVDTDVHVNIAHHIQHTILNAWIQAAVKQAEPPKYVWLKPQQPLQYASIFNCLSASPDTNASADMHPQLLQEYDIYQQGQQALRNWQEIAGRLQTKYFDKGGITARLAQLQNNALEAKAQTRHMHVLHSIWLRQTELLAQWAKMFDFIPALQRQRLYRLYAFFKQNFPQEQIVGLTQPQLDALFLEKLRRAENNERMVGDALHQVENDSYQQSLLQDRCTQWCSMQGVAVTSMSDMQAFIEQQLWPSLARTALVYWQQDFAAKCGYADFCSAIPRQIDLLLVEYAQYVDPIQAVQALALSKRATVFGNYNPICNPRYPVQIDFELAKYYGWAENDADFEDLQFDGVLGSVGNMWGMVAKERDADQIMSNAVQATNIQYELLDVQTSSASYHGSLVNQGAVSAVVDWLHKHAVHREEVAIYTCFAGQVQILQQALSTTFYASVLVRCIQEPCFSKSAYSIFVPVYSSADAGPYIFDRGTEMFDQLVANTTQKLIVVGDKGIFKPHLHSATGKFAKLFNIQTSVEIATGMEIHV